MLSEIFLILYSYLIYRLDILETFNKMQPVERPMPAGKPQKYPGNKLVGIRLIEIEIE